MKDSETFNLLFDACTKGDLEKIRSFFLKPNPNILFVFDSTKKSPLHHACRYVHFHVVDYLLTKGLIYIIF